MLEQPKLDPRNSDDREPAPTSPAPPHACRGTSGKQYTFKNVIDNTTLFLYYL